MLIGSGVGLNFGSNGGNRNLEAALLSYILMNISLPSVFDCFCEPEPFLNNMAMRRIVSFAGTPKKERTFAMSYSYLLVATKVAWAAGSVVPHVNFTYFQSAEDALRFVITP